MPSIRITTLVTASQDALYEYVTAFPARGEPNISALERKYGAYRGRKGYIYTFHEDDEGATWQCTFRPPEQRVMRTFDSTWSNRADYFEEAEGGTLWTIVWEPKGRIMSSFTQWLAFQLKHRKQVNSLIILPVLEYFRGGGPDTFTDEEHTFY